MTKLKNWMLNRAVGYRARDEEGQGLVEYGLIIALIAVVCIAALTLLGTSIAGQLGAISTAL